MLKIAIPLARGLAALLLVLALGSCGGGSGDGASNPPFGTPPASFIGVASLTPPPFVVDASPAAAVAPAGTPAPTDMLFPPGVRQTHLPAVCQPAEYALGVPALPTRKATAVTFQPVNPCDFVVTTGATAYTGDPNLGQLAGIEESGGRVSIPFGAGSLTIDNSGPQPAAVLTQSTPGAVSTAGHALPRSATLNPAGFTYQTFGRWTIDAGSGPFTDGFLSMGITTSAIPATGIATYTGVGRGTFVSAATGELFDARMTVTAEVDFAARTIRLTTTSTMTAAQAAPAGTAPSPNAALDLTGTLVFPVATNTFSGATAGVTGNVMGRFYGAPLAAATTTKAAGSPPEIGGTFGVFLPGVGSLIGSFGAG